MKYVFGPVPSRRLGRSLGIDLVPFKTCTYDCTYCQLGRTTTKTVERQEWTVLEDVLRELRETLANTSADFITLSGSGEPTLHLHLDELIHRIHRLTDIPVAVLTNGSLLWRTDVRKELLEADLVVPSLDAGNDAMFRAVNRPHDHITFEMLLEGLVTFRKEYRGEYWLEVFLLAGYTDDEAEVQAIIEWTKQIRPNRVQLNTATRPTAENGARKIDHARLAELANYFEPAAEVIADYRGAHAQEEFQKGRDTVLSMVQRRPCSIEHICSGLAMHRNTVIKYLDDLEKEGLIQPTVSNGQVFYFGKQSRQGS